MSLATVRLICCLAVLFGISSPENCADVEATQTKIPSSSGRSFLTGRERVGLRMIDQFEGWNVFSVGADKTAVARDRATLFALLRRLDAYDTGSLRKILVVYLAEDHPIQYPTSHNPPFLPTYIWDWVYICNRYIFDVPKEDLLPLGLDSRGDLTFAYSDYSGETPANYSGPPYEPLEEFDYFARVFGRRRDHRRAGHKTSIRKGIKSEMDSDWLRGWD